MPRATAPERMDDPAISHQELVESFRFIEGINRWLGGKRALLTVLATLAAGGDWPSGRPLRLLDVGTGVADLPEAAWRWCNARGLAIEVVAIDSSQATIDLARARLASVAPSAPIELRTMELGAIGVQMPARFDLVHAAMLLHHFDEAAVICALRTMSESGERVVWNDLWRNPASRVAVRAMTLATTAVVRHDAVLSVDKGFSVAQMRSSAHAAGLRVESLRRMPLTGRLVATLRRA